MKKLLALVGMLVVSGSAFASAPKCSHLTGVVTIDGSKFSAGVTAGLENNCENPYQCMPTLPKGVTELRMNSDLSPAPQFPSGLLAGSIRCTTIEAFPENLVVLYSATATTGPMTISFAAPESCMDALDKINKGQKVRIGFESSPSQIGWIFSRAENCE